MSLDAASTFMSKDYVEINFVEESFSVRFFPRSDIKVRENTEEGGKSVGLSSKEPFLSCPLSGETFRSLFLLAGRLAVVLFSS